MIDRVATAMAESFPSGARAANETAAMRRRFFFFFVSLSIAPPPAFSSRSSLMARRPATKKKRRTTKQKRRKTVLSFVVLFPSHQPTRSPLSVARICTQRAAMRNALDGPSGRGAFLVTGRSTRCRNSPDPPGLVPWPTWWVVGARDGGSGFRCLEFRRTNITTLPDWTS